MTASAQAASLDNPPEAAEANAEGRFALVDALLPQTVARARAVVPLYAELHRGLAEVRSRSDLATLPTVDRALLMRSGERALASDRRTDFLGNTSGTTGKCLLIHCSNEEEQFTQEFFSAFAARVRSPVPTLVFSLAIATHGTARSIPVDCFSVGSCVLDDGTARNFAQYLREAGDAVGVTGGVRMISAALDQLLLFTCYCLRNGLPPRDFQIGFISVTGDYISSRLRTLIEEHWGSVVIERYSMSEIFGGASQRGFAGGFDFDRYVMPELVDADSTGTGELVLTTLDPFVQRQPMIRYRTGDIFTPYGNRFRLRGRAGHCLRDPRSNEFLLYGTDLYDLFDEFPQIAREARSLDYSGRDAAITGKPVVSGRFIEGSRLEEAVRLSVGLVFDPACRTKAAASLRDEIVARIETLSGGRISPAVEFVPAGQIEPASQFRKSGFLWEFR